MPYRMLLLNTFAAASIMTLAPVAANGDVPCFMCHEACVVSMEQCYAYEKCEGDFCEATMEEKICSNID